MNLKQINKGCKCPECGNYGLTWYHYNDGIDMGEIILVKGRISGNGRHEFLECRYCLSRFVEEKESEEKPIRIKEGEIFNVKIEAVGERGDGVVRVKGFVIFIPDTKEGEGVKIKITKVLNKFAFAKVIKRL